MRKNAKSRPRVPRTALSGRALGAASWVGLCALIGEPMSSGPRQLGFAFLNDPTEKKYCSKCKEPKLPEEFHREKSHRDGRQYHCKDCERKRARKWREKNPERHSANGKRWSRKYPEKVKTRNQRFYANLSWERRRDKTLKHGHGITLDEYNEMLAAQEGDCAICGEALEETDRSHPVDHDHSLSGPESVRGIVHQRCNMVIGLVEKEGELLRKAEVFVLEWKSKRLQREAAERYIGAVGSTEGEDGG